MIQFKLTKDRFKAIIQVVDAIRAQIKKTKHDLKQWDLAMANGHLFVLDELSRKMRSKLVMIEHHSGSKKMTYSFDAIQCLVMMNHSDMVKPDAPGMDPYSYSIFKEISDPISLKLLS